MAGQEHRSMISSMDEITVLLKCNNNTEASTVTQRLSGQAAVRGGAGVS